MLNHPSPQTLQAPTRAADQDWKQYLDLSYRDWRWTNAPNSRPFFVQGRVEGIIQAGLPANGRRIVLAEYNCNVGEFVVVQHAGVEAYFRTPNQALGTPSTRIPPADLGMGVFWEVTWRRITENAGLQASAALRDLEGLILGDPQNGFTQMSHLSINEGWFPLDFEDKGVLSLTLNIQNLGVYSENAILFFQGRMGGYASLIPSSRQDRAYPYGKKAGGTVPQWNPLDRG